MQKTVEFKWHPEFEKSRALYSNDEVNDARFRWIRSVMFDPKLKKSASARNIAFALMDKYFNIDTGQCNPAISTLGALFDLKLTATKNMLKVLADAGWITIVARLDPDNPKQNLSNQYRLEKIELKKREASAKSAKNDNHPQRNSGGGTSQFYGSVQQNPDGEVGRNSDHKPNSSEPHERNQGSAALSDRRPRKTYMTNDFELTEQRYEIARRAGLTRKMIEPAFEKFKLHASDRDRQSTDWDKAWSVWAQGDAAKHEIYGNKIQRGVPQI